MVRRRKYEKISDNSEENNLLPDLQEEPGTDNEGEKNLSNQFNLNKYNLF